MRAGLVGGLAALVIACSQTASVVEPSATELLQKANANRANAKTAHIEGTGSFTQRIVVGSSTLSYDLKLNGEAEMPDKTRLTTEWSFSDQSLSSNTITIGGRAFTQDGASSQWTESPRTEPQSEALDPLPQLDLSSVATVTELDRPDVDGRKTRHLSYTLDQSKLVERMKGPRPNPVYWRHLSGATGTGEVWVRTDDLQIVRQLVKHSLDFDFPAIPGFSPATKSTIEFSFDLKFSRIGEPVSPAITAPPTQ